MHWATLCIILALAAIEDLELRTIDISHAFINGDIDTEIYMRQPEGFREGGSEKVCRLNKSLYGLKQSPRLWSEKLTSILPSWVLSILNLIHVCICTNVITLE